jgi:hypothetical protein
VKLNTAQYYVNELRGMLPPAISVVEELYPGSATDGRLRLRHGRGEVVLHSANEIRIAMLLIPLLAAAYAQQSALEQT